VQVEVGEEGIPGSKRRGIQGYVDPPPPIMREDLWYSFPSGTSAAASWGFRDAAADCLPVRVLTAEEANVSSSIRQWAVTSVLGSFRQLFHFGSEV
jgi:hypothetical protein